MICELDVKSAGSNVWRHARHLLYRFVTVAAKGTRRQRVMDRSTSTMDSSTELQTSPDQAQTATVASVVRSSIDHRQTTSASDEFGWQTKSDVLSVNRRTL